MFFGGAIGFTVSNFQENDGDFDSEPSVDTHISDINPATGLLMTKGTDVAGNPYRTHINYSHSSGMSEINPATGLLMIGDGTGGFDVGGSPYGTDINDSFSSGIGDSIDSLLLDDHFSSEMDDSASSLFDDSFGSSSFDNDW